VNLSFIRELERPMAGSRRRSAATALLALIGGAVVVWGCFLAWLDVGGGVSVRDVSVTGAPKGAELLAGTVAIGAGIAVLVLGFLVLLLPRLRAPLALLVLVGGLLAVASAAYALNSPEHQYADFAVKKGASPGQEEEVRASVINLFEGSFLQADPGVGLYVVVGGGAMAVLAGLVGLRRGRRTQAPSAGEPEGPEPTVDAPEEGVATAVEEPISEGASTGMEDEPEEAREPEGPKEPEDVERIQAAGEGSEAPPTAEETIEDQEPIPESPRKPVLGDEWSFKA
jgi:hypothetical protein